MRKWIVEGSGVDVNAARMGQTIALELRLDHFDHPREPRMSSGFLKKTIHDRADTGDPACVELWVVEAIGDLAVGWRWFGSE